MPPPSNAARVSGIARSYSVRSEMADCCCEPLTSMHMGELRRRPRVASCVASTQTHVQHWRGGNRAERCVDAVESVSCSVQAPREACTQTRHRFGGDDNEAKFVIPRAWVPASEVLHARDASVTALQCSVRRRLATRRVAELRLLAAEAAKAADKAAEIAAMDAAATAAEVLRRRTQPRTISDFAVLRREVESAALVEVTASARDAAMLNAAASLRSLDGLKRSARLAAAGESLRRRQVEASAPRTWKVLGGTTEAFVETPASLRAGTLAALLAALRVGLAAGGGTSTRLALLNAVVAAVKPFAAGALGREVIALAERERETIAREREAPLPALRARLAATFALFVYSDPGATAGQAYASARTPPLSAALALTKNIAPVAEARKTLPERASASQQQRQQLRRLRRRSVGNDLSCDVQCIGEGCGI